MRRFFSTADLPKYHDALLIMKVRPTAVLEGRSGPSAAEAAAAGAPLTARELGIAESAGLSALETLERGGLVKRVIPVARPARAAEGRAVATPRRAMVAVAAAAETAQPAEDRSRNAGVCVVELQRGSDVPELQGALAHDPNVEFVSRVPVRYLVARRSVPAKRGRTARRGRPQPEAAPPAASSMWNLRKIQWAQARRLPGFKDANQVRVGVLDTGIDKKHPDLKKAVAGYVYAHPDTPSLSGMKDIVGHGTHVAGTVSAMINNDLGINGVCACRLHAWKIFNDTPEFASWSEGFAYFVDPVMYLRALADCVDEDMDVVNLSIGGGGEPDAQEQRLFDALLANGTAVVAAMGNEREDGSPISYPAAIPGVIAVGATSLNDGVTAFSNRGDHIALCAPGKAIWSTLPTYPGQFGFEAVRGPRRRPIEGKPIRRETDYDAWDGTSMASPHVAAAAALLIARDGRTTSAQVRQQLTASADRVRGMRGAAFHPDYGSGRLNLLKLLR
jgi:subtilisin family serine protease